MFSDATLVFGEAVATALLGVDALYRAESADGDGLVVLNMDTAGRYRADPFGGYADAHDRWIELRAWAADLPEPDRRVYYGQLCDSTLAFIEWRRDGMSFERQLGDFLHVPVAAAGQRELAGIESSLGALLDGMGYVGSLADRCRAWEERNRVPPQDVPAVAQALLDEAWDLTEEHVLRIPAPRSDGMSVAPVSGVAYNARCDYRNRTIELNVDPVLTRPALKHLAVHEGAPGHYLQFKLRETWAAEGTAPADVLLSVVNTASSSVFEGIADAAMGAIGWVESDGDRLQALLNRHRAGIGTVAAWKLHAERRPLDEVSAWLRERSLVGGEGWVDNRIRFIAAPGRAVLIWSYWWGERSVAPMWRSVPGSRRPDFLRFLYGRMHSNQSVEMFE